MKRKITGIAFIFCFAVSLYAQNRTVSGYVRDAETKETLAGCNIVETGCGKGHFSNTYGFYSLTLPKGKGTIRYSFLGYETQSVSIDLTKDTTIQVYLTPVSTELSEVVVSSATKLKDMRLGIIEMPVSQIKNTPALLGETDLMKSLQLIPGVQNTSEGKSDLSVRGGSPDQNLILLDGVPVYNPNHVFGFLSVFNTDALKKVTLYKSSFPARFGGRLSSVVDITTKDGNRERFSGSATVGLPTFRLNLEGPIVKDRTSFTFSARRTYMDLLVDAANKWFIKDNSGSRANFSFYDLNAKIHHKINNKTYVYLSACNGNDGLNQETAETAYNTSIEKWNWGNTIVSGKLNSIFSPTLFFKGSITYNRYNFRINTDDSYENANDSPGVQQASRSFLFSSGIKDYSASGEFEYSPAHNHAVKFGTAFTFHDFNPEVLSLTSRSDTIIVTDNAPQHVYSKELALYAEDDWDISQKTRLNAGLRFSRFSVDNKTYTAIDPRLSLRYLLTDKLALQAGYSLMQQYVHLLSSNSVILQTDLWVPVTGKIKPMQSSQYSAGVFYELSKSVFFSFEAYYKDMRNVIEYKDGVSYTSVSAGWENKVEAGTGRACGMELSVEKREGRITGTASYTLSKSERRFENINFGEWFPAKYDRRHALNLLLNYRMNAKFDFTAAWTYHSGDRITLPMMTWIHPYVPDTNGFPYEPQWDGKDFDLLELDHRNNYQMADYHRLDLGVNYTFKKKKNRCSVLNVSVYNVYNRMNPYKIIMESDLDENRDYVHKLRQITLFPVIPSLSYTYHF